MNRPMTLVPLLVLLMLRKWYCHGFLLAKVFHDKMSHNNNSSLSSFTKGDRQGLGKAPNN